MLRIQKEGLHSKCIARVSLALKRKSAAMKLTLVGVPVLASFERFGGFMSRFMSRFMFVLICFGHTRTRTNKERERERERGNEGDSTRIAHNTHTRTGVAWRNCFVSGLSLLHEGHFLKVLYGKMLVPTYRYTDRLDN